MSSTSIYSFRPTYLYIKQHSITGKLYFGKTIKDPEIYLGSGTYWTNHIKKHGEQYVVTLWYCLFLDEESITEFAALCSKIWNIVESDAWANLTEETGLGGTAPGHLKGAFSETRHPLYGVACREETKQRISAAKRGKITAFNLTTLEYIMVRREEFENNVNLVGVISKEAQAFTRKKVNTHNGRTNYSKVQLEVECPHCHKLGKGPNMTRYHFDKCKSISTNQL